MIQGSRELNVRRPNKKPRHEWEGSTRRRFQCAISTPDHLDGCGRIIMESKGTPITAIKNHIKGHFPKEFKCDAENCNFDSIKSQMEKHIQKHPNGSFSQNPDYQKIEIQQGQHYHEIDSQGNKMLFVVQNKPTRADSVMGGENQLYLAVPHGQEAQFYGGIPPEFDFSRMMHHPEHSDYGMGMSAVMPQLPIQSPIEPFIFSAGAGNVFQDHSDFRRANQPSGLGGLNQPIIDPDLDRMSFYTTPTALMGEILQTQASGSASSHAVQQQNNQDVPRSPSFDLSKMFQL